MEHWATPLSSVRRCWLAMPPVAGFLEMFAGVSYNREKNESLIFTPLCTHHQLKHTHPCTRLITHKCLYFDEIQLILTNIANWGLVLKQNTYKLFYFSLWNLFLPEFFKLGRDKISYSNHCLSYSISIIIMH